MILQITAKCSDACSALLTDNAGKPIAESDGYVPQGFGISSDEDYVEISVDLETGKIVGFKKPSKSVISKFIRENEKQFI